MDTSEKTLDDLLLRSDSSRQHGAPREDKPDLPIFTLTDIAFQAVPVEQHKSVYIHVDDPSMTGLIPTLHEHDALEPLERDYRSVEFIGERMRLAVSHKAGIYTAEFSFRENGQYLDDMPRWTGHYPLAKRFGYAQEVMAACDFYALLAEQLFPRQTFPHQVNHALDRVSPAAFVTMVMRKGKPGDGPGNGVMSVIINDAPLMIQAVCHERGFGEGPYQTSYDVENKRLTLTKKA